MLKWNSYNSKYSWARSSKDGKSYREHGSIWSALVRCSYLTYFAVGTFTLLIKTNIFILAWSSEHGTKKENISPDTFEWEGRLSDTIYLTSVREG